MSFVEIVTTHLFGSIERTPSSSELVTHDPCTRDPRHAAQSYSRYSSEVRIRKTLYGPNSDMLNQMSGPSFHVGYMKGA